MKKHLTHEIWLRKFGREKGLIVVYILFDSVKTKNYVKTPRLLHALLLRMK